ncbi:hypothetical protein NL676_002873 [Syzygium grande]|nr:hypothetical protein NL676_002873 [Syzygium grande]
MMVMVVVVGFGVLVGWATESSSDCRAGGVAEHRVAFPPSFRPNRSRRLSAFSERSSEAKTTAEFTAIERVVTNCRSSHVITDRQCFVLVTLDLSIRPKHDMGDDFGLCCWPQLDSGESVHASNRAVSTCSRTPFLQFRLGKRL